MRLAGPAGLEGRLRVIKRGRRNLPGLSVRLADKGVAIKLRHRGKDFRDYRVPAKSRLILAWQ